MKPTRANRPSGVPLATHLKNYIVGGSIRVCKMRTLSNGSHLADLNRPSYSQILLVGSQRDLGRRQPWICSLFVRWQLLQIMPVVIACILSTRFRHSCSETRLRRFLVTFSREKVTPAERVFLVSFRRNENSPFLFAEAKILRSFCQSKNPTEVRILKYTLQFNSKQNSQFPKRRSTP